MVKKLCKLVHIYRRYRQNKPGGPFFWTTRYINCIFDRLRLTLVLYLGVVLLCDLLTSAKDIFHTLVLYLWCWDGLQQKF